MGIIQRQALRNSIVQFAGSIIGGITRMITPIVLPSNTEVGLLNALDSASGVFVAFFSFGYNQVLVRLFPKFRNSEVGHHGFLLLGLFLSLLGVSLSCLIFYWFGDNLVSTETDVTLFQKFSLLIFPMIFFRIIFFNIDGYVRMLYQTFIGLFLDNFLNKIIIIAAMLMYVFVPIDFDTFVYIYALSFCVPGFILIIFAFLKTEKVVLPSRELRSPADRKKTYEYMLFGMLIGASGSIVLYFDQLMIGRMLSLEMVGIYSILFFAARFILIPANSISRIAQVVISEAWEKKDLATISDVYEKSCVNQLLIAAFLFGLGIAVIDPVFSLHPRYVDYLDHTYVFMIVGAGIVIEMGTGINTAIIATSAHYRYNMYFNLLLAGLVILLNYFMISAWQLKGAAFAALVSMTIFNFCRFWLLYRKYGLQPFNRNFMKALILTLVYIAICALVDYDVNPWLKIAINTVVLTILFWLAVIRLKLSVDVNQWLIKMKRKFF